MRQILLDVAPATVPTAARLQQLKDAAKWLVDEAYTTGDAVGVIAFNETPTVIQPLTLVDSADVRESIKAAIDAIESQPGDTAPDLVAAVDKARDDLRTFATEQGLPTSSAMFYLFSGSNDTVEFATPPIVADLDEVQAALYTFGFGADAATNAALQALAANTSGRHYAIALDASSTRALSASTADDEMAQLLAALAAANQAASDAVEVTLANAVATVTEGSPVNVPVQIDSALGVLHVAVMIPAAASVNATLTGPDSQEYPLTACTPVNVLSVCELTLTPPSSPRAPGCWRWMPWCDPRLLPGHRRQHWRRRYAAHHRQCLCGGQQRSARSGAAAGHRFFAPQPAHRPRQRQG